MRKNGFLLTFLALCLMFLVACSSQERRDTNVLNYGSTKDIGDLNPHLYNGEMAAQNMIFQRLVSDDKGVIEPELATEWTVSDDGKTYTFQIREGVSFTDGTALTATAVKQNFDAVLANKERHGWMGLVNEIDKTEVEGDYVFKLYLKQAYYPTLTELSLVRPFAIASPKTFIDGETKDGVTDFVGTGPYVLKSYQRNKVATFEVNDNYWGDKPKIKTINWQVIPSFQTLQLSLEKGSIDLIFGSDGDQISSDSLKSLEKNDKLKVYYSDPNASRSVLLNSNHGFLKDKTIRQAISYAINKKEIVNGVLDGLETEADTIMPETAPYMKDLGLTKISYNQDEAKQLLEDEGWVLDKETGYRTKDGQELTLTFSVNSQNAQEESIAQVIQSNLKAVGIEVTIISEDKQTYLARQKSGDFDMQYSLSWGAPYDPQTYLTSWRVNGHGDYQAQLGLEKKAWLDDKINQAILSTDESQRQEDYKEIMTYITDQYIYVPISFSRTKAVATSDLKGIYFPTSQYEIPFASMYFD